MVTLVFRRQEILDDCRNYAYIEGDAISEDRPRERYRVMAICDEGNIDRISRLLDLSFAQIAELCYPYSKSPACNCCHQDNELRDTQDYILRIYVPEDFSCTTVQLLGKLFHELLVYKIMADWLGMTLPEEMPKWQDKTDTLEKQVISILNSRICPVRRTLTPF